LWPGRFGKTYLQSLQRRDVRGFSALYQGRPSPAGGTFFSVDWLQTYRPNDLPANLRCYAASDHAVALKQGSDKTCLMVIGVDKDDTIWVLPDLVWRQMNAEQTVEAMLRMMKRISPLLVGRAQPHQQVDWTLPAQADAGDVDLLLADRDAADRRQAN
jgi:hypothetical protein